MTPVVFWDVDTQVDFIHADGKLYVPDSEAIVGALDALTRYAHARGIPIVASADDHLPGHRELSGTPDFRESFPAHCMRGTPGQRKIVETTLRTPLVLEPEPEDAGPLAERIRAHDGDFLLHKHWFDVFTNAKVATLLDVLDPETIVVYGVALDVCNRYAIDGLLRARPGLRIFLVTDATRAIDPGAAGPLLAGWRSRGVQMVTAADVLRGAVVPR